MFESMLYCDPENKKGILFRRVDDNTPEEIERVAFCY